MRLTLPAGGPRRFLRYPLLVPDQPHLTERLALRLQRFGPISCPVCGQLGYATRFGTSPLDFRDAAYCSSCLATNRQRQLASVVCAAFATLTGRRINSLMQVTALDGFVVYNTEAQGPIHQRLAPMPGYRCSEYVGPNHASGTLVGDVVHQKSSSRRSSSPERGGPARWGSVGGVRRAGGQALSVVQAIAATRAPATHARTFA
jgi:hypothetical protein